MSTSNSPVAFLDCYTAMDQALADKVGIRMAMPTTGAANHFRMRCNQARVLNRNENTRTYPIGSPLHGRSEYDSLVIRILPIDGTVYVYFEKRIEPIGTIESLSALENSAVEALAALPEPKLIGYIDMQKVVDDFTGEPIELSPQPTRVARRV